MAYPQRAVPNTQHSVFYAYSIHINGVEIGSLESFAPSSNRQGVEKIREVLFSRGPEIKEIVWGGTDTTVTCNRVEYYEKSFLEAFGASLHTLEDFTFPVNITEIMQLPPERGGGQRVLTFVDAVATSWSKTTDTGTTRRVESMAFEVRTVRGRRR